MNRIIIFLGLLCGFLAGVFLLVLNPWVPEPSAAGARASTYQWTAVEYYGVQLNEVALLNLPVDESGNPVSANLATANASIVVLRAPSGEAVALGTRLVSVDESSQLLQGNVGVNTYMNLFWPNRGSVLLVGYENRWPVIRSGVLELLGQRPSTAWPVTTQGPGGFTSRAVGGSGTLESVGGRYTETLQLGSGGDGTYSGEIALELSLR